MIQKYSLDWPIKFKQESNLLKLKLGNIIFDIQHIGSTSIPGLSAKPIIDIMIATKSLDDISPVCVILEELGYSYKPNMSSTERLFFRKGSPVEFHLSITQPRATPYWENQILFRNYLIKHPEVSAEYEILKFETVKKLPEKDLDDLSCSKEYSERKGPFIRKIIELAREEKKE